MPSHGSYELLHLVERLPARREFYQSRGLHGASRGGLTHADEVHGTATRLLADENTCPGDFAGPAGAV